VRAVAATKILSILALHVPLTNLFLIENDSKIQGLVCFFSGVAALV
jgi:hypothetical protein